MTIMMTRTIAEPVFSELKSSPDAVEVDGQARPEGRTILRRSLMTVDRHPAARVAENSADHNEASRRRDAPSPTLGDRGERELDRRVESSLAGGQVAARGVAVLHWKTRKVLDLALALSCRALHTAVSGSVFTQIQRGFPDAARTGAFKHVFDARPEDTTDARRVQKERNTSPR